MPKYIGFFSYTGEAWARMIADPADRAEATRVAIEDAGGAMESFYWMHGRDDGFVVYEVPSAAAATAFAAGVKASGRIGSFRSFQLLDPEEARSALELAKVVSASYRPPGSPEDWRAEYDALGG